MRKSCSYSFESKRFLIYLCCRKGLQGNLGLILRLKGSIMHPHDMRAKTRKKGGNMCIYAEKNRKMEQVR